MTIDASSNHVNRRAPMRRIASLTFIMVPTAIVVRDISLELLGLITFLNAYPEARRLSVEETAEFFHISETKVRSLINEAAAANIDLGVVQ